MWSCCFITEQCSDGASLTCRRHDHCTRGSRDERTEAVRTTTCDGYFHHRAVPGGLEDGKARRGSGEAQAVGICRRETQRVPRVYAPGPGRPEALWPGHADLQVALAVGLDRSDDAGAHRVHRRSGDARARRRHRHRHRRVPEPSHCSRFASSTSRMARQRARSWPRRCARCLSAPHGALRGASGSSCPPRSRAPTIRTRDGRPRERKSTKA